MGVLHRWLQPLRSDASPGVIPILFALVLVCPGVFAQVGSIDILVPRKAPPLFQIAQMVLTVQVDTTAAIGFTMTPPAGAADSTPSMTPGVPSIPADTMVFGSDLVRFYPPDANLAASDPRRRNYRITISPNSDFDPNSCLTQMTGDETWTLAVTGGALRIVNACLISEDENTSSLPVCDGNYRVVPATEAFSEIGGLTSAEQSCRFGVEAMLVLDRSGSMSGRARPAEPVSVTNQKIVSLRDAVTTFMTALTDVRAVEAANGLTVPADRMGVVIFNSDAGALPGVPAGLNNFDATLTGTIDSQLAAVGATGSTSIGDGLILAASPLGGAAGDVRRVILLMSDGKQNTDQRVSVVGDEIVTHGGATACPAGSGSPGCALLPNDGNFSVCSVTVGTGTAVDPAINQDVALAGDCFYLNSEDDAAEMSAFFLNVLQNFLEAGSWQTLLAGSGSASREVPALFNVPVTSTTQGLSVTVVPRTGDFLCLNVTAPGQPPGDPVCSGDVISYRRATSDLPSRDMGGEWQIGIEVPESTTPLTHVPEPPRLAGPAHFHLMVLGDDIGTHASAEVLAQEFAPGKPIRVRVRLDEHGAPLQGLSGTGLDLRLASPGLTLGELMAGVTPDGGGGPDASDADAAIENAIAADPSILLDAETVIALTEGDPGVYEAQFSIERYGHADLVLTLRGVSPRGGSFIRQIRKTIYIKAVPDATETEVATQVIQGPDVNRLAIQLTPKTIGGFPVGPGWKNYYWLRGPGVAPFKLEDDLNGTYSGTIDFSGAEPPMLSVHFIPDSVSISDQVPASELPSALDDTTVLIPQVGTEKPEPPIPWWLKILIAVLVVLLLICIVLHLIRRRDGA